MGEDARIYSCCLGAGWIGGGRQFSQCRTHIISRPIGLISHIMALLYLFWWSSAFPCRKKCWWPLLIETEGFFLLCWSSSSLLLLGRCISYELVIVVAPILALFGSRGGWLFLPLSSDVLLTGYLVGGWKIDTLRYVLPCLRLRLAMKAGGQGVAAVIVLVLSYFLPRSPPSASDEAQDFAAFFVGLLC